ncbi:MAG: YciI family protein [Pseudomonadota bacterium]
MIAIVKFEDEAGKEGLRAQHMQAHLAFIDANAAAFIAAGPAFAEDGTPVGGYWLLDVEDRAAARVLVEADPFWSTGLRKTVEIVEWRRVWADGARLI